MLLGNVPTSSAVSDGPPSSAGRGGSNDDCRATEGPVRFFLSTINAPYSSIFLLPRGDPATKPKSMRTAQSTWWSRRVQHGGEVRQDKRKEARPIATKAAMHITLRAKRARGKWSLLEKANARFIEALIATESRRWRVKV